MNCPVCSAKLRLKTSHGLVVNVCPACSGILFGKDLFKEYILKLAEDKNIRPGPTTLFQKRDIKNSVPDEEETRICPRCSIPMKKFNYAYDSNIFLDQCQTCSRIWSDAGETAAVASHIKTDPDIAAVGAGLVEFEQKHRDHVDIMESRKRPIRHFSTISCAYGLALPIGDDLPLKRFPFYTVAIILLCVVVFIKQPALSAFQSDFVNKWGFIPAEGFYQAGLITSMFLHANTYHLLGNMLFLWLFGDKVEDHLGRLWFPMFYFVCGLASMKFYMLFNADSQIPCIGSSGAISGIMGAYLVIYPGAKLKILYYIKIVKVPAALLLAVWIFLQFFNAAVFSSIDSDIAYTAHIGGFITGVILGFILKHTSPAESAVT